MGCGLCTPRSKYKVEDETVISVIRLDDGTMVVKEVPLKKSTAYPYPSKESRDIYKLNDAKCIAKPVAEEMTIIELDESKTKPDSTDPPCDQFNTQPLYDAEVQAEIEQQTRDAAHNFYTDNETLKWFVDVRVPIHQVYAANGTNNDICVPLTVENLDETLESAHKRMCKEVENQLETDVLQRCNNRVFVFCGDQSVEILENVNTNQPNESLSKNNLIWREYIKFNEKNLISRPRPIYGGVECDPNCKPIDTNPITIRWTEL